MKLKRNLRLEKVVTSKQLRLAVETEEERRTRLEAFLKSWQLCLSFKLDVLAFSGKDPAKGVFSTRKMVPITGRARSFLLVFKNKIERRG